MKNKEQKIVRLLEEGFSYDTIKKMNDYHLNKIYKKLVNEEETSTVQKTTYSKQDIQAMKNKGGGLKVDGGTVVPNDDGSVTVTQEMGEDDSEALDKMANLDPNEDPNPEGNEDGPSDNMNANDGMGIFEDINEEEVLESLFGKPKMKTPITTLGMFEGEIEEKSVSQQQQKIMGLALSVKRGDTPRSEVSKDVLNMVDGMTEKELEDFASTKHKNLPKKVQTNEGTKCWKGYEKKGMKTMFGKRVPNCVKKESTEEKIRQIEESIVSLIKKSQGKMLTKKDILSEEPSIAPARPTVKPGVKPERATPYKPKHNPKPKAGTEIAPARPTVKPGVKPERATPYKPKHSPKPKAGDEGGLPEFLKFSNLNIQFRDE